MNLHFFHVNFTTTIYGQNLHNYLIPARSRDVIETEPISPSVRKLFDSKYIWVTTLTFWGHVTSLVM